MKELKIKMKFTEYKEEDEVEISVNKQRFIRRYHFYLPDKGRIPYNRERALLFGAALEDIGAMVMRQAEFGKEGVVEHTNGLKTYFF